MDIKLTPQITPELGEKMSPQITATLQGYIGRGASGFEINGDGNLIVTMTDGQKIDLGRVKGDQGATITSIEQTAQSGDYTTYTITLSDGQTFDFEVKAAVGPPGEDGYTPIKGVDYFDGQNGKDGKDGVSPTASVQQTATGAKIIITDSSGKTEATITNGTDGTDGEDAPEITDISINSDYHLIIKLSDGSSYDAGYCRGASGSGTGDMQASTYDPQGKNRDIFAYVDEQMANIDPDVTADEVTFADGETFQEKYDKGELTGPTGPAGEGGAAGSPGKDGEDGVGIESVIQTTTSSADGGENVITVTKTDGSTSTFKVKNGSKGSDGAAGYTPVKGVDYFDGQDGAAGADGNDGVGIQSVEQTTTSTADGGENVITVKKTDGSTSTFSVKNGSKGSDGAPGATGPAGSATQYTVTLPSEGWMQTAYGYMVKDVSVPGLVSDYNIPPDIDVVLSLSDLDADKELMAAFGLISAATTRTDVLSVYCAGSTPSINVPIVLRVWE